MYKVYLLADTIEEAVELRIELWDKGFDNIKFEEVDDSLDLYDEPEDDYKPDDIDSDFGYDPYMGECTYDC